MFQAHGFTRKTDMMINESIKIARHLAVEKMRHQLTYSIANLTLYLLALVLPMLKFYPYCNEGIMMFTAIKISQMVLIWVNAFAAANGSSISKR